MCDEVCTIAVTTLWGERAEFAARGGHMPTSDCVWKVGKDRW